MGLPGTFFLPAGLTQSNSIKTSIVFVGNSEFFVIDSGKVITSRRCSMAVTLAVVQMEDFYTLSPDDENAHAEFSF